MTHLLVLCHFSHLGRRRRGDFLATVRHPPNFFRQLPPKGLPFEIFVIYKLESMPGKRQKVCGTQAPRNRTHFSLQSPYTLSSRLNLVVTAFIISAIRSKYSVFITHCLAASLIHIDEAPQRANKGDIAAILGDGDLLGGYGVLLHASFVGIQLPCKPMQGICSEYYRLLVRLSPRCFGGPSI